MIMRRFAAVVLCSLAVVAEGAGPVAGGVFAAAHSVPGERYGVLQRYLTYRFGESEFRSYGAELYTVRWYLDGVLQESQDDEFRVTFTDGIEHSVVAEMTLKQTGRVVWAKATWEAPLPMSVSAPPQSARIASKRGILVRVRGVSGFYRASTKSKRIPGSGNARIRVPARDCTSDFCKRMAAAGHQKLDLTKHGSATIRIKGAYLDRIKPGQTVKVEARRLKGSYAVERAIVAVAFT